MSQAKLLRKLIQSLTDPEFDIVAEIYLKEVDDFKNVVKCNGPYDSGLDFRNSNISEIEVQFQATTKESGFEKKLRDDLEKAKNNVKNYNLPNRVKYFYSYPLSNRSVLNFKKIAKTDYGLVLDLIEGGILSEIAIIYDLIREKILELSDFDKFHNGSEFFESTKVRAFYDLMSIGSATDIKFNIIKSFVINYLNTNGPTNQFVIIKDVNTQFESNLTDEYFESIFRRMNSQQQITKLDDSKIDLTDMERERLMLVLESYKLEEAILLKKLTELLDEYNIADLIDDVIIKLSDLYESNYTINLSEFTHRNSTIYDLQSSTTAFIKFLCENNISQKDSENLANKLFVLADENSILSRIAAGQVFSKVSDPDRLQDYISQHHRNKDVFIDTNVLINLLCAHYEPNADYDNYHYKVAQQFLKFSNNNGLRLKTIRRYAIETTNLFKNALNLIPFTKLPYFTALGKSSNILYNFFLHLSDWQLLDSNVSTFEEFLKEFRFEARGGNTNYNFRPQMEFLLESLEVEIDEIQDEYILDDARKLIDEVIRDEKKYKSHYAANSDAIMIERLGDPDIDINPIEPIFCTWDMALMKVRRLYFQDFPNSTKWFMYTPTRLMDHFSMMNLKVKKGSLSNEVLTILEEDFNFQNKTQSLIDSVKTIINPDNQIGLKYTNKLAELREKEIVQINEIDHEIPDVDLDKNAVDIVFHNLLVKYAFESEDKKFDSLKLLFTKEELFDPVIELIQKEIKYVHKNQTVSDALYQEVDKLINNIEN